MMNLRIAFKKLFSCRLTEILALIFLLRPASRQSITDAKFVNKVSPLPLQPVYEFWLEVHKLTTMAVWQSDRAPPLYFNLSEGRFYERKYQLTEACDAMFLTNYTMDDVVTVDGTHRNIIAVNGSLPGPTITVYQHSRVIIHVTNNYENPVTIHWHGLDQRGSFFFDGVAHISQCPIAPKETFTFNFTVPDNPGTYWYHGHIGMHRDGMYGAFIILDRDVAQQPTETAEEFIAIISDWFPYDNDRYYQHIKNDAMKYEPNPNSLNECYYWTRDTTGQGMGTVAFDSALVNGRGWRDWDTLAQLKHILPIERFSADRSKLTKFRIINAALVFHLVFGVSGHRLRITASDGQGVVPETVDFVNVQAGERFDVELIPLEEFRNYSLFEIRLWTMERFSFQMVEDRLLSEHFGIALLNYGSTKIKTASLILDSAEEFFKRCRAAAEGCIVANCPFREYPPGLNHRCLNLDKFRNSRAIPADILSAAPENIQRHFLNVRFQMNIHSINGIEMAMPAHPPFMHPTQPLSQPCAEDCGFEDKCSCTHVISLRAGKIAELIIYNKGFPKGVQTMSAKEAFGHPMHLHGHHFYILKQGWSTYDSNGITDLCESDTSCEHAWCNHANWTNTTWHSHLPSANLNDPIAKDTVYIPFGGYVVVRFKADNPGWWLFHCHVLPHQADGMALVFKEEPRDGQMPKSPPNYPVCGRVTFAMKDAAEAAPSTGNLSRTELGILVGCLVFAAGLLIGALLAWLVPKALNYAKEGQCKRSRVSDVPAVAQIPLGHATQRGHELKYFNS